MKNSYELSRRSFLQLTGMSMAAGAVGTTQAARAPAADEATMEPIPLRVAHWWGDAFDNALAAFTEQHPHLDITNEPAPWDGYHTKIPTSVAAGTAADAMFMDAGQFMVLLPQGVATDLTE